MKQHKSSKPFLLSKLQAEEFRTIDSDESDEDEESQSSKGSSKDGHFSTFSTRSFPRRQKRRKHQRSAGYQSENDVSAILRSDLRRDMQLMMRDVVRTEMLQPTIEGGSLHQSYQNAPIPPFSQMNLPVNQQPSFSSYILPFLCGCILSCIGLSYLALIVFALLRQ